MDCSNSRKWKSSHDSPGKWIESSSNLEETQAGELSTHPGGREIKLLQELRFLKAQVLLKSGPRAFLQHEALSPTPFFTARPFPLRAVSAYRPDPVAQLNYITLSKHPQSNAPPSSVNSRPLGRPVGADVRRGELTFARTICKWQAVSAMGNENAASGGLREMKYLSNFD